MPSLVRTARVFISSTFRDMHAERDHLVRYVFPALEERCRKINVRIVPLDLRWGVTEEEAEQGRALEICLDEIDRARPFFVGLLGERYGWVPEKYETADHARFDWLRDPEIPGHSITALEIIHGVLRYERQRPRSFFYFRDPGFSGQIPEKFRADFAAEDETARGKLERLKGRIRAVYEPGKHGFLGLLRTFLRSKSVNQESQASHLREYSAAFGGIRDDGAVAVTGLEKPFGEQILEDLWGAIQAEFPPVEEIRDELTQERDRHLAFVAERSRVVAAQLEGQSYVPSRIFVGREQDLQRLEDYVQHDTKDVRPLVVLGRSGSGKTSLLAELASRLEKASPGVFILPVFAGLTPASRPVGDVLERITAELERRYGFKMERESESREARLLESLSSAPVKTAQERVNAFQGAIWKAAGSANEKGPAVILIDAADQMLETGEGGVLSWLPGLHPADVKIVITVAEGTPAAQAAKVRQLPIQPLEPLTREEAALAIQRHLEEHRKQLGFDSKRGVDQLQLLLAKADIVLPLYLAVACEELRVHPRFETLSAKIESLPGGVTDLLDTVLARIEADHGADLASNALALLACSGGGLTEPELLSLLSDALGKPIPVARWAPLRRSLATYLRGAAEDEGGRYFFFHRLLEEAVRRRYLSDREAERRTYALLADAGLRELDRTLALKAVERAAQSPSPPLARVGYALFKAGRDGEAEESRRGNTDTTLAGTLHRLLDVDDESWPWYMVVFDTLIAQVQGNEDEYATLEEQLMTLSRRLTEGAERAWRRLGLLFHETGGVLQQNGFSLLAGCLFRSYLKVMRALVAAEPHGAELLRDLSISLRNLGRLTEMAGQSDDAWRLFEESLDVMRALVAKEPHRVDFRGDLSLSLNDLGCIAGNAGRSEDARRFLEESLDVMQPLVFAEPRWASLWDGLAASLNNLGELTRKEGRSDDANQLFVKSLEVRRSLVGIVPSRADFRRRLWSSLNSLGRLAQEDGHSEDARRFFEESLDVVRGLVAAEPHRADLRRELSVSLSNLGRLARKTGRSEDARCFFDESLEVMRPLVAAEPQRADLRHDLSISLNNLGRLTQAAGSSNDSRRFFQEALGVIRFLVAAAPDRADLCSELSASLNNLGELAQASGRSDEAHHFFQESLDLRRVLVAKEPHRTDFCRALAVSLNNLGNLAQASGSSNDAQHFFEKALEIRRALVTHDPHSADFRRDLSVSLNDLGRLTRAAGRSEDARLYLEEGLDITRALVAAEPHRADLRRELSVSLSNLGRLAQKAGRSEDARRFFDESLDLRRTLVAWEPHRADFRRELSVSLHNLGNLAQAAGRSEDARRFFEESLEVMRALVAAEPHRADVRRELSVSLNNLGKLTQAAGCSDDSRRLFQEALDVRRALVVAEPYKADLALDLAMSCWNMFGICVPSDKVRWLTEASDLLQSLRSSGFRNAQVEQLWRLVAEQLAARRPGPLPPRR